jgi:hypothetical protein
MDGIRQDTQFFLKADHFKDDTSHYPRPQTGPRRREDSHPSPNPNS